MIAITIVFSSLIVLGSSQYQKSSKDAAILTEARYLAVNGQFGSSYKQEDGVEFKEESDLQGNRKGSYSYVDPTGKRRTVTYTAGKDGFRASGEDIPVPPVPVAPVAPAVPSVPQVPIETGHYRPVETGQYNPVETGQYNPADDYQYESQTEGKQYNQYNNYQYNSPSYTSPPPQPQYNQFQYQAPAVPSYNQYSTEPAHRFLPPGKLNLNRSPDGFSYTFNKA